MILEEFGTGQREHQGLESIVSKNLGGSRLFEVSMNLTRIDLGTLLVSEK